MTSTPFTPGLERVGERWRLVVVEETANPRGVLYGGAPLAASIIAAEAATGTPARWATTRFLRGPQVGEAIDLAVRVDVAGYRSSHVSVVGSSELGTAFDTMLVTGSGRPDSPHGQWVAMPDVPSPDEVPTLDRQHRHAGTAIGLLERRPVRGVLPGMDDVVADGEDGRIQFWTRIPGEDSGSRPVLAWLADCLPLAIVAAFGSMPIGASLDNTIRFGASAETDWVLVDVQAHRYTNGYGHGTVSLWSQSGLLLATASQTATLKLVPAADGLGD